MLGLSVLVNKHYSINDFVPGGTVTALTDLASVMRGFPRRMLVLGADATQWRALSANRHAQAIWNHHMQGIGRFLTYQGVFVVRGCQFLGEHRRNKKKGVVWPLTGTTCSEMTRTNWR